MLSESDIMKCLNAAGCYGNVKMTFESGPYCIDRPSINASKFAEQVESAATTPLLAEIERLTRELEEARRKAQEDNYEFNRAINFAIDQGSEACHFLSAWREGDPSGWPEFNAAIKEQT